VRGKIKNTLLKKTEEDLKNQRIIIIDIIKGGAKIRK